MIDLQEYREFALILIILVNSLCILLVGYKTNKFGTQKSKVKSFNKKEQHEQ